MNAAPESPAPTPEKILRNRYGGSWGRAYQSQKRAIPPDAVPWVARLRAQKFQPWILQNHVVLEYGVAHGWNLAALVCQHRWGYDLAGFLADELRQQGIGFVPDLATLPAASVDVILCHHTLEHLWQPGTALEEMHRLLRPGGLLLLFVPFEKERRYRRYHPAEPNQHLYSWNVQTLGNLVTIVGFEVLTASVGRFGYDRFAAAWASRLRLGERGFRLLRAVLHLVRPSYEVRLVARRPAAGL